MKYNSVYFATAFDVKLFCTQVVSWKNMDIASKLEKHFVADCVAFSLISLLPIIWFCLPICLPSFIPQVLWILLEVDYGTKMSTLRGRERERGRDRRRAWGTQSERESDTGGDIEKDRKKMERTPRPEMGREWDRRWSVTGVSTPPYLHLLQDESNSRNLFSAKGRYNSTVHVVISVYVCMFLREI